MKRYVGPILLVMLVIGVGAAIYYSASDALLDRRVVTVRGLIGSEKSDFFRDPQVIEALRKHSLAVQVEKVGAQQMASNYDLSEYDFAFPAGSPAAEKMRRDYAGSESYQIFYTPLAIASWQPIAEILVANGVAEKRGGYYAFDMGRYLDLVRAETRWNQLANSEAYAVNKSVLITSADVRTSNLAEMYLALASYVANGENVVPTQADAAPLMPLLEALFLKQGYTEQASTGPFEDYLAMGMGKAPMVMAYEAQFIYAAARALGGMPSNMVLMYPEPTMFSKHILVAFSEDGIKLGEALVTDPDLQRLAIEHGFRNENMTYFNQFTSRSKVSVPDTLVNVVEPPSYEVLADMTRRIADKY